MIIITKNVIRQTDSTESPFLASKNYDSTFDFGSLKNSLPVLMGMLGRTPLYAYLLHTCFFRIPLNIEKNETICFSSMTPLIILKAVLFPTLTKNKNWADLNPVNVKLEFSWGSYFSCNFFFSCFHGFSLRQ